MHAPAVRQDKGESMSNKDSSPKAGKSKATDLAAGICGRLILGACFSIVLCMTGAAPGAEGGGKSTDAKAILDARSPWRIKIGFLQQRIRRSSGELQFATVGRKRKITPLSGTFSVRGGPARKWTSPEFDDLGWAIAHPPLLSRGVSGFALISLRGKFTVSDPGTLKDKALDLLLSYRGGVVVTVNGTEVGRGHMPAGKIKPETPAADYPKEAYVSPEGKQLLWVGFGHPAKYKVRFAKRTRELRISIPKSTLRKGTNVLGLEVHRAPTSETYYTARYKHARKYSQWDRISLDSVKLSSPAAAAVSANVSAPGGVRVWNWPAYAALHSIDFGDPHRSLKPVQITGARNGAFCGQVVVSSTEAIKGLTAEVSELKGPGKATIAAASIQLRYPRPSAGPESSVIGISGVKRPRWPRFRKGVRRFEALETKPPAEVSLSSATKSALLPVWITVNVPADAQPGNYTGTLSIRIGAKAVGEVPLSLSVADWRLPDPNDFATLVGLVQSPDSLALKYEVPMWSKKHWKLLDQAFALLAQVGTKDIYITARARTYFGNQHSMVRWIRKADGKWDHDFSIAQRYVDLAVKHLGKVPIVGVYSWDVDAGSTYFGHAVGHKYAHHLADKGTPFTVLDPKTGKLTEERSPKWSDPEAVAFWKPVYDGIRAILAKHGMEKSMMVGLCPDKRPEPHVVKVLKAASGGAPWISHAHPTTKSIHGQPVGYMTVVWTAHRPPPLSKRRCYGWKNSWIAGFPRMSTFEMGYGLLKCQSLVTYRKGLEKSLIANRRGVGRMGADFWNVIKDKRGRSKHIVGRFKTGSWHGGNLYYSCNYILAPGDAGPVSTTRFEMLRRGAQEAEARIHIEKILTDPARRAKLGEPLATRLQGVLDDRFRRACGVQDLASWPRGGYTFARASESSEVTTYTRILYAAAAEVAAAVK
jgi:Glycoside hydrolase 123, catalytic domain/Glycoside hydrolase 123 N-terminal domain